MAIPTSEAISDAPSIVFIMGATASGKSEIGLQVAQCLDGEVVCIDSRTVYGGMDIGTAKPTQEDQELVPHHLLDIASIDKPLSALDFRERARASIVDISARGKLPVLIGGASLYGDAVLYDYVREEKESDNEQLEHLAVVELQDILSEQSIPLPFNQGNRRDLVSYVGLYGGAIRRIPRFKAIRIGVEADRDDLLSRIGHRTEQMRRRGLEGEVRSLAEQYGWGAILSSTIGYQEFRSYFDGNASIDSIYKAIAKNTIRLADYQATWFSRYEDTTWADNAAAVVKLISQSLVASRA